MNRKSGLVTPKPRAARQPRHVTPKVAALPNAAKAFIHGAVGKRAAVSASQPHSKLFGR
jgi:hypothetical protein